MSLIAKRYAQAFADLSFAKNSIDVYKEELSQVSGIYEAEGELRAFLLNPKNDISAKKAILSNIFLDKVQPDVLHLLFLLLDKGRIGLLPEIYREYIRLANERQNILDITIMTALPLDVGQIDRISEIFLNLFHSASVKADIKIDPALIGGVKVFVRDKVYDGTIKGKLTALHSVMGR